MSQGSVDSVKGIFYILLYFHVFSEAFLCIFTVTYCHDLPGLITYKKIVEGYDDSIDVINVIGVDEGKSILNIIWNWSVKEPIHNLNRKHTSTKKSFVLAAVANVKESYHNISVLGKL